MWMNSSSSVWPVSPPARSSSIVPCATNRPCAMTPIDVQSRSTISRMCDVRKIVPPRLTNDWSRSLICRDATASMPSNGSSRKSSRGAGSSAAASDSFLRMPCEKSVTSVELAPFRSMRSSRSADRLFPVAASSPCTCATKVSVSSAVRRSKSARSSGTTPMRFLTDTASAGRIRAQDAHAPRRGPEQSRQALDGRGLAGAVGAEKPVETAGRHGEVDAVHGAETAEVAGQAMRLDGEVHGDGLYAIAFGRWLGESPRRTAARRPAGLPSHLEIAFFGLCQCGVLRVRSSLRAHAGAPRAARTDEGAWYHALTMNTLLMCDSGRAAAPANWTTARGTSVWARQRDGRATAFGRGADPE